MVTASENGQTGVLVAHDLPDQNETMLLPQSKIDTLSRGHNCQLLWIDDGCLVLRGLLRRLLGSAGLVV